MGEHKESISVWSPSLTKFNNVGATGVFDQKPPHLRKDDVLKYEGRETVRVTTLDALHLGRVHFMKVDVEGALEAVLRGARQTIMRHQPLLAVEHALAAAPAILLEWGYHCTKVIPHHDIWICLPSARSHLYG